MYSLGHTATGIGCNKYWIGLFPASENGSLPPLSNERVVNKTLGVLELVLD
jgi:hypothetical protein